MTSSTSRRTSRHVALIAATGASLAVGGILIARAIYRRRLRSKRYPQARRSDHTDEYWGETVEDPYRWMEDPDSEETKAWVRAQVKHTDEFIKNELEPSRSKFWGRLKEAFNYDKFSAPWRVGDFWFVQKQEGLSAQTVLYKQKGLDGEPEILLDPNQLSADGTSSLHSMDISKDGKLLVYGISKNGSDWFSIYVRDVETVKDMPDVVNWCKFGSMAWEEHGRGFFYSAFARQQKLEESGKSAGTEVEVATGHRIMYHRLGTDSSKDQLVYQSPSDEKWLVSPEVTDDWKTLLIRIGDSCDPVNRLFYRDLSAFDGEEISTLGPAVKLVDNFDSLYAYVTNEDRKFWFRTNLNASRYKVVKMELPPIGSPLEKDEAALANIEKTTVVPEHETGVLTDVSVVAGDRLILMFEKDAYIQLELCDLSGGRRNPIDVPGIGYIGSVFSEKKYDHFTLKFTNFVTPGIIFHGTVEKSADEEAHVNLKVLKEMEVPGICGDDFETKQVRYKSKDGTVIPMFVFGRKQATGPSPCILYGYGGFNVSMNPNFSASRLLFVQHFGGRFCMANIRGGGEYGEQWHNAGILSRKQNGFDDFMAAAKYLVEEGYARKEQLAIMGGSNGGLLIGACVNQHPELFAAAVAQAGVMDMLRFDRFTIGYAWRSDFGSAEASEDQFRTLRAYSPVHNVKPESERYPAVLLTTGDHDDRVCPLHSFKYMAELQHTIGSRQGEKPLLIRIDMDCGHGGGKPTAKVIAEVADIYAFIAKHTGANWQA